MRPRKPPRITWRHGVPAGTVNLTLGLVLLGLTGDLAGLAPWWGLAFGVMSAATALVVAADGDDGQHRPLAGPALFFRVACWLGAGIWLSWVWRTSPWAAQPVVALLVASLIAGLLAGRYANKRRDIAAKQQQELVDGKRQRVADAWAKRIARVCNISVDIVGVELWDHKAGFTLDGNLPEGGNTWRDLEQVCAGLAADAKLPEGCGVEASPGVHRGAFRLRVSTRNALVQDQPYPSKYAKKSINDPVTLGCYRDASPVQVVLRWICTVLAGQTGSGKTNILQVVNAALAQCTDTLVWHVDIGGGGGISIPWLRPWIDGRAPRPAVDWVATTVDEARIMAETAIRIGLQRKQMYRDRMREADDDKIPVGHSPADDQFVPQIVIVVDEMGSLPGEIRRLLAEISDTLRAVCIRLVSCGLRGTDDYIPTELKEQAGLRIGMRVTDEKELAFLMSWTDRMAVEDAPYPGCGFVKIGQESPRPFKAYRLKPNQIEDIAVAVGEHRPALDTRSAKVAGVAYADRWNRATHLLGGNQPDPQQMEATMPEPEGTIQDAFAKAEASAADLRRLTAEAEGRDPDLAERFDEVVDGVELVDWSDPTTWPSLDKKSPAQHRMVELVKQAGADGITPADLLTALQKEFETDAPVRQTVHGWLTAEVEAGTIQKTARGLYTAE